MSLIILTKSWQYSISIAPTFTLDFLSVYSPFLLIRDSIPNAVESLSS
jgi:hypothetical protein